MSSCICIFKNIIINFLVNLVSINVSRIVPYCFHFSFLHSHIFSYAFNCLKYTLHLKMASHFYHFKWEKNTIKFSLH